MTKDQTREYYLDTARVMAFQSILSEIVRQHGISEDQFQSLLQRKVNYYVMKCLQMIEDKDPNYAAALQILNEDELQADLELPSIFPS